MFAFLPCLRNGFVNWDDDVYVAENPGIVSLSFWSVKKEFSSFLNTAYQPLALLNFQLEYRFFKLNPFGYHLVSLFLHILNSLLVFWLIYLIAQDLPAAFITTVIFSIHPLRVESVAWISEQKGLLAVLFFLSCVISYLYYLKRGFRPSYYWLALLFCGLSLISKAVAVVMVLVLLLLDYVTGRDYNRKALTDKIPFLCLSVIFGIVAVIANNTGFSQGLPALSGKIFVACFAVAFYIQKFFLPLGLCSLYPVPARPEIFLPAVAAALIFLCAFLLARAGKKEYLFGLLFFLALIFPALQFVRVGQSIVADRYSYLPSLGLCFILGLAGSWALKISRIRLRVVFGLVFLSIIAIMGVMTFQRAEVWRDGLILWSDCLLKHPIAASYTNRGNEYSRQGNFTQALKDFSKALEVDLAFSLAYLNRGVLWERKGSYELAVADFDRAHALIPKSAKVLVNRAKNYEHLQRFKEAMDDYNLAVKRNPDYAPAYLSRGVLFYRQQDYIRALADYSKVIEINPYNADAYYNRGLVNKKMGEPDKALDDFTRSIKYGPLKPDVFYERAGVFYEKRDYASAIKDYTRVIEINPVFRNACRNRAFAYFYNGDYLKSLQDITCAKRLQQDVPDEFIQELNKVISSDKKQERGAQE